MMHAGISSTPASAPRLVINYSISTFFAPRSMCRGFIQPYEVPKYGKPRTVITIYSQPLHTPDFSPPLQPFGHRFVHTLTIQVSGIRAAILCLSIQAPAFGMSENLHFLASSCAEYVDGQSKRPQSESPPAITMGLLYSATCIGGCMRHSEEMTSTYGLG